MPVSEADASLFNFGANEIRSPFGPYQENENFLKAKSQLLACALSVNLMVSVSARQTVSFFSKANFLQY